MRCGCILVLLAIALVIAGGQAIREAHAFNKPVDITCEQFLKSPRKEGWYRIKGCFMDVDEAAYSVMSFGHSDSNPSDGSGIVTEVYLPVHYSSEKSDDAAPTTLLIKTKDEAILNTVKEMRRFDDNTKSTDEEVKKWVLQNVPKLFLHKDVMGMVLTGINDDEKTHNEIANLKGSLAPGYVIVEEGKTPSMSGAIGLLIGGILVGLVSLGHWANILFRPKNTE